MPIYEYRCTNDHTFEVVQSMSAEPVTKCEECGAPVERVFHPIAVHFKGSGFYNTDYKGKGKEKAGAASKSGEGGESKSSSDSSSKSDSKSSDSNKSDSGKAKSSSSSDS